VKDQPLDATISELELCTGGAAPSTCICACTGTALTVRTAQAQTANIAIAFRNIVLQVMIVFLLASNGRIAIESVGTAFLGNAASEASHETRASCVAFTEGNPTLGKAAVFPRLDEAFRVRSCHHRTKRRKPCNRQFWQVSGIRGCWRDTPPGLAPLRSKPRQSKGQLALRHGGFELLRAAHWLLRFAPRPVLSALRPDKVRVPREKGWFRKEPDQNPMRPAL
jgi:hypothetical protein